MSKVTIETSGNLFSNVPHQIHDEVFDTILAADHFEIKRIISKGQRSPANFWYDQKKSEWVVVLKGAARLEFKDDKRIVEMIPGAYIHIPAHCKHRVEWTDPDVETIWLAIYF